MMKRYVPVECFKRDQIYSFLACRLSLDFLLNEEKMPAFSFCILEGNDSDVVNRGSLVYLNHKNSVC